MPDSRCIDHTRSRRTFFTACLLVAALSIVGCKNGSGGSSAGFAGIDLGELVVAMFGPNVMAADSAAACNGACDGVLATGAVDADVQAFFDLVSAPDQPKDDDLVDCAAGIVPTTPSLIVGEPCVSGNAGYSAALPGTTRAMRFRMTQTVACDSGSISTSTVVDTVADDGHDVFVESVDGKDGTIDEVDVVNYSSCRLANRDFLDTGVANQTLTLSGELTDTNHDPRAHSFVLDVLTVADSTVYTFTIGGAICTITSGAGATASTIELALASEINNNDSGTCAPTPDVGAVQIGGGQGVALTADNWGVSVTVVATTPNVAVREMLLPEPGPAVNSVVGTLNLTTDDGSGSPFWTSMVSVNASETNDGVNLPTFNGGICFGGPVNFGADPLSDADDGCSGSAGAPALYVPARDAL